MKKTWITVLLLYGGVLVFCPESAGELMDFAGKGLVQFLWNLIPVFLCVGLMDVWLEKEQMIRMMGEESGLKGAVISLAAGMVTAVPVYALLPVAGMVLKKGSRIRNVMIFLCASLSIRIPLLLFEISSLGAGFALCRFLLNLCAVFLVSFLVEGVLTDSEKERLKNM